MLVENYLEQSARFFPEKIALIAGEQRLTYRQIEEDSNRLAHALIESGVKRGDRVALCLENSVEAVISIFAVLKAGAIFTIVDYASKADKLAFILNQTRARVLIVHSRKLPMLEEKWNQLSRLESVVIVGDELSSKSGHSQQFVGLKKLLGQHAGSLVPPQKCVIDLDLAALIYTSGSTGNLKGVMLTHLNMISAADSITSYLENTSDDIILNALPLSFDYGLYQVLMTFKMGGTLVLERSFTYPYSVIEKLIREKVTGFPLVPTILAILLQMDLKKFDFSALRFLTSTGSYLPKKHIFEFRKIFPHVKIYSMYGLTECKRVSYLPPGEIESRPASVGKGMPNQEICILDESGNPLGPGEVGELVIRGSHVMKGYWEMPVETAKVLKPGLLPDEKLLYSGDLFWKDDAGYLYFVGRKDEMIKTKQMKVSPKEIETLLYDLDGIREAVVIGVPDAILGQALKAIVTLDEGADLTEKDILGHISRHLEKYMVPKYVEFRNGIPKTASGKFNKLELTNCSGEKP